MIVADAMVIAYALVEVPERTDEVNGALERTPRGPVLRSGEASCETCF